MVNGYRTSRRNRNIVPDTHPPVGRSRVPVDPGDGEVHTYGGKDLQSEAILLPGFCILRYIERIQTVCTLHLSGISNLIPVYPQIRTVIYTMELQPHMLACIIGWKIELCAVPPGRTERVTFGGVPLTHAWQFHKVISVIGIRVHIIFYERGKHSRGYRGRIPVLRGITGLGYHFAVVHDMHLRH